MMINFKDFASGLNRSLMESPSVRVNSQSSTHTLYLKFDSKDTLTLASYFGPIDPWLGSLCTLIMGKKLKDLMALGWKEWDETFQHDQTYWDLKNEKQEQFFFGALEFLHAGLDMFRGREYLYKDQDPLICRCFGVREKDVLEYIHSTNDPTPEGLATAYKAGMGCRSCVPQLTQWMSVHMPKISAHYYKEKPRAHWLLEIDYMLSCFPEATDWKMEVISFQGTDVKIAFDKEVSQKEEEAVALKLQDFLGAALDSDLSFFLSRSRQRPKASR